MTLVEKCEKNGYTVEIHYDEDGSYSNPRDNTNLGLFLGRPHRSYNIGDERLDLDDLPEGTDVIAHLKEKYGARVVLPVGMLDHSGVSYYVGGGAHWCDPGGWDSGLCGFIFDTTETRKLCGGDDDSYYTVDLITEVLTGEIGEYGKWANGEVYGVIVKDRNGDEVESSWGLVGFDYAKHEAESMIPNADEQPEKLYTVRLTAAEMMMLAKPLTD